MGNTGAVARSARRRMIVRLLLAKLGPALLIASAGSLSLVAADKFTTARLPWLLTIGAPVVAATGIAAWLAWRARPSLLGAAGEVDHTLRLKDQLSTAMVMGRSDDPFAAIAIAQGQAAASTARVDRAVPIRLSRSWAVWPAVLAGAILAARFVPELSPSVRRQAAANQRVMTQAREVSQRLDGAVEAVADASRDLPQASEQELASLRELQRELDAAAEGRPPSLTPDQAISRAAEALDAVAARQDARAEELRREAERTQSGLDRLDDADRGPGEPESPLARAVREGDLQTARRAADQLLRGRRPLDDRSRAQAARDLARLAEELRQLDAANAGSRSEQSPGPHQGSAERAAAEPTPAGDRDGRTPDVRGSDNRPADGGQRSDNLDDLGRRLAEAARELDPAAAREGEQAARDQAEPTPPPPPTTSETTTSEPPDRPTGPTKPEVAERPSPPSADQEQPQDGPSAPLQSGPRQSKPAPTPPRGSPSQSAPGSTDERQPKPQPENQSGSEGGDRDRSSPQGTASKPSSTPSASPREQERPADNGRGGPARQSEKVGQGESKPASGQTGRATPKQPGTESPSDHRQGPGPSSSAPGRDGSPEEAERATPRPGDSASSKTGPATEPTAAPGVETARSGADQSSKPSSAAETVTPPDASKDGSASRHKDSPAPSTSSNNGPPSDSQSRQQPRAGDEQAEPNDHPGGDHPPDSMTPAQRRALERLSDQLKKMSDQPAKAAEHERSAERLREQARRLYEGASPEQRERMARWMQQAAGDRPPRAGAADRANNRPKLAQGRQEVPNDRPPASFESGDGSTRGGGDPTRGLAAGAQGQPLRTTPVDARSPNEHADSGREQVVAEWLGSGDERREPVEQAAVRSRLLQAARSAERAIDDRSVPSRYDRILREYFRRLPERVAPAGGPSTPAPAAQPAPDGGSGR